MGSGTSRKELEQRISEAVKLPRRAVAVGFLDAPPAGLEEFKGTEPSGCSFWRLAAAGKSFYTVPENHFQLCRMSLHAQHSAFSDTRTRNGTNAENDVRSWVCEAGGSAADSSPCENSHGHCVRAARGCHIHSGRGSVCVQTGWSDAVE